MSRTVLIVEDEVDLADLLTEILTAAGYDVVLTSAGKAVARAGEVAPVAIIVDFVMPGFNGAEVMEQLRSCLPAPAPPMVLVSGLENVEQLARESHAAAFLRKPFDVDHFVATIDRVVNG